MSIKYCKSISKILGYFIYLIFCGQVHAQDKLVAAKNNPLLNHLLNSKTDYIDLGYPANAQHFIDIDNRNLNEFTQILLKDKKGLYIIPTMTGRIYKASYTDGDSIYFKRLDSTHFYGYNGGAFYFSYNDTLFNFGGYGLWNTNGHLRYYSTFNREWNIKALNFESKVANVIPYLNRKKGFLYYTGDILNPGEKNQATDYWVTKLNLNKQENEILGRLNADFIQELKTAISVPTMILLPSLGGTFISLNYKKQYLLDFESNKILKLKNERLRDLIHGNSYGMVANNGFAEDTMVYFTLSKDSSFKLHNFPISRADFETDGEPIYLKPTNWTLIGGIGLLALVSGLSGFYWWRKKKLPQHQEKADSPDWVHLSNEAQDPLQFLGSEMELIKLIHASTLTRRYFSVEDINNFLGISKKSLEIQKKMRTETLNRINHKFKVRCDEPVELIERVRSEQDRRYYKYMISPEKMERLKAFTQQ